MNRLKTAAVFAAGLALGAGSLAAGQAVLPAPVGEVQGHPLANIDLGRAFPVMKGYVLHVGRITVPPHAGLPMHSHRNKPEVLYFLQGHISGQTNGGKIETYGPGDVLVEDETMTHTLVNQGSETVVYLGAHVGPTPPPNS
jgi:quercetin dioxygenase-like cupin family protein